MTKISAFQYALRLLQSKPYGTDNLRYKLALKEYPSEEIESAVIELSEYGYLDDVVYANNYVENLINYKTFGYYGIRQKLKQKRLPETIIEPALKKLTPEIEYELAVRYCRLNKKKNKKALMAALSRRGFRSEALYKVINNLGL